MPRIGGVRRWIAWAIAMTFIAVPAVAAPAPAAASAIPRATQSAERPVALVYRGQASCEGCAEAVADLLQTSRFNFDVRFVGPGEQLGLEPRSFVGVTLYAQPGGNLPVGAAHRALGRTGRRAITQFVAAGGRYLGFCMGAYLAGSGPGMGLLGRGDTDQYIGARGATVRDERDALVRVKWGPRWRWMFFQDGPYFLRSRAPGERILARYSNGLPAALVVRFGSGRVGAVGPHPEATRSWYGPRLWRRDRDRLDTELGYRLVERTMG